MLCHFHKYVWHMYDSISYSDQRNICKILPFTAVNVVKFYLLFQVTSPRDKIGQCATPPNLYFIHDP